MKIVCSSKDMRILEERSAHYGISPLILMENAAIGIYSVLEKEFQRDKHSVLIVCGRGNNGGDGMALARHLVNRGWGVFVIIVSGDKPLPHEANINFEILKNLRILHFEINQVDHSIKSLLEKADIIVDAIFGTGLKRDVSGVYKDLIDEINICNKKIVSIDIPSGIDSDNGKIMGTAIKADITVALGFLKPAHLLFPGREYAGETHVVNISIPYHVIEAAPDYCVINEDEEKYYLKKREKNSHKGYYGHLALIGSSIGKAGAIIMSAKAALRAGAGLVTIGGPKSLKDTFGSHIIEPMYHPIDDIDGFISGEGVHRAIQFLVNKDALLIGPGLAVNDHILEFFFEIINKINLPIVIDADGINCLSKNKDILKIKKDIPIIVTPHPGEMARLAEIKITDVIDDPLNVAIDFAKAYNVHLVLKSATTIYADPSGKVIFSTYGNPGMATAGTGDVLSGIIASFLAQGYNVKEAISLALMLHGIAGDEAAREKGENALIATDIIEKIPVVLKKWEESLC